MPAYPNTPPPVNLVFNREDSYRPPVGLSWSRRYAILAFDDKTTKWLDEMIIQGSNAALIASGLVSMGVLTEVEDGIIAAISGIVKLGSRVIFTVNNKGGNKGIYFLIPYEVFLPGGSAAEIPVLYPKARY